MCGYVLWLNVCSVCVCVCVRVLGRDGGRGAASIWQWCVRAYACVYYCFLSRSENICIPLNPACVALIISCMHQGFLSWRSHKLASHHMPPRRGGSLPPPARALERERRQRWESTRSRGSRCFLAAQCSRSSSTY